MYIVLKRLKIAREQKEGNEVVTQSFVSSLIYNQNLLQIIKIEK